MSNKLINWGIKENNSDKVVMIVEKNDHVLDVNKDNPIILEGTFAQLGVKNNNGRIYEENEYLPQIEMLQSKIKSRRLLGELDHPKSFETSLKNVSHVIEKIWYDKSSREIKGRIQLLNNEMGKIARSLVEAQVPISISSRAAGVVDDRTKRVKIKRLFTFDLVCDPGFENAQLSTIKESLLVEGINLDSYMDSNGTINLTSQKNHPINEELGITNSNILIYNVNESNLIDYIETNDYDTILKNKNSEMSDKVTETNKFITHENLNEYSKLVKEQFEKLFSMVQSLSEKVNDTTSTKVVETIENLKEYSNYLATAINENREKVEANRDYNNYLAETLDNSIIYSEYLAENIDKNISYSEYLAESLDKNIEYSKYLAENIDKNISYSEYLAENLDHNISYSNYLAENIENNINYSEYLAENLDSAMDNTNKLFESNGLEVPFGMLLESDDDMEADDSIEADDASKKNNKEEEESKKDIKKDQLKLDKVEEHKTFLNKVDDLIMEAKKKNATEIELATKFPFLQFLSECKQDEFLQLDDTSKENVSKVLKESNTKNEAELLKLWENALKPLPKWLELIPMDLKSKWNSLNDNIKNRIINESKSYKLESESEIDFFWSTRKLEESNSSQMLTQLNGIQNSNIIFLNENKSQETGLGYSTDHIDKMLGL